MSIDANRHKDLPRDIQFDSEKGVDFVLNYSKAYVIGGESAADVVFPHAAMTTCIYFPCSE